MSEREALHDEVELLARSLDDARAEHDRGDLDAEALAEIERRDGARLRDARERLDAMGPAVSGPVGDPGHARERGGRRRRPALLVVAALCAVVVAVVLADPFSGGTPVPRVTAQTRLEGLLAEGELAVGANALARALTAYDAALRLDPRDAEALVEAGWLRYELGVRGGDVAEQRLGAVALARAVRVAPADAAGHLYDGIVLWRLDHACRAATVQVERSGELPESSADQSVTLSVLRFLEGCVSAGRAARAGPSGTR